MVNSGTFELMFIRREYFSTNNAHYWAHGYASADLGCGEEHPRIGEVFAVLVGVRDAYRTRAVDEELAFDACVTKTTGLLVGTHHS